MLYTLYEYAEQEGIDVDWFPMPVTPSLSVQLPDGTCAVGLDPWKMETVAEEKACLAHELGHCATGSFYNPYTRFEVRQRLENRADKWAIKKLIPRSAFFEALKAGNQTVWQLAEWFNLPEPTIKKAASLYLKGNLAGV